MESYLRALFLDQFLALPRGLKLPAIEFFRPTRRFIEWMVRVCGDEVLIYDVGAGTGLCAARLRNAGLKVTAIDHHCRDRSHLSVEIADGVNYPYEAESIVMLCRPCHGFFTQAVISQAIERRVARVIYVGLARNIRGDADTYARRFRKALTLAGEDGEAAYIMEVN